MKCKRIFEQIFIEKKSEIFYLKYKTRPSISSFEINKLYKKNMQKYLEFSVLIAIGSKLKLSTEINKKKCFQDHLMSANTVFTLMNRILDIFYLHIYFA